MPTMPLYTILTVKSSFAII